MSGDGRKEPQHPVVGSDAFRLETQGAELSRAAQYLGMSAYAFGGDDLATAVQDEGDYLRVPHVMDATGSEFDGWRNQDDLDFYTGLAARHHGVHADVDWDQPPMELKGALWSEIDGGHQATTLLALLNLGQRSESQVEAVAAAGCLAAFSSNLLDFSNQILDEALSSDDPLVRAIAACTRDVSTAITGTGAVPASAAIPPAPVSTAIHGTWGLVSEEPWYRPGSPLYEHLRNAATPSLYRGDDYYVWSGEYSDYARAVAAGDLTKWRSRSTEMTSLDTVYAHSHGGNVALNAAAAGEPIKLLVLLHTPANHRSDEEWAVICDNVGGVVAMRTRFDLVVLMDSLSKRENRLKFDPRKLPHFPVVMHWDKRDAWFTHSRFVTLDTWQRYDLANIVKSRYAYIGERIPASEPIPITPSQSPDSVSW